ncbi:MAG TPA: tetratricopeptide repeat protein [Candidatus Methylacidiphilales bacterium]|nr:tetratricopeptide repeat protein [Candidatus Methylacidiphilales bacterium]
MAKRSKHKKAANQWIATPASGKTELAPSVSSAPPEPNRDWLWGAALIAAILLVYTPLGQAGFIWDDDAHVTRRDLRSLEGLERIWFDLGATQQYYPLVHSVFWAEHRLWGDAPLGYHLVNVGLCICSVLLLLKILRRLEIPGAWLAAAIFALHPVQVESVAWISELKNMLSGALYFGAALLYLEFDRSRRVETYAFSLLLFVLGLLSKSVIASLPAALLVVFWWKRGKLSVQRDAMPLIPFFTVGIISGLLTAWVEKHFVGAEGGEFHLTPAERGLIAGRALWFYFGKLVWPSDLSFIYTHWDVSEMVWWQYLFPAAALILAAGLVWAWVRWRWRGPLAGFLFFAGTLFPALGFFNVYPFRYSYVADHFQYLAGLGVIVPCAAGLVRVSDWMLAKKPEMQPVFRAGVWAILAVLSVSSWQRAWAYRDEETLWNDTLAKNPACWMAYGNLGVILFQQGHIDEAVSDCQKALAIKPDYADAHNNLGSVFIQNGQVDEAIKQFQKAVEINPNYVEARNNLGGALAQKGELDQAMAQYEIALKIDPDMAESYYNLGNIFLQKGELDEAIIRYQQALKIDPGFAEAHYNLGNILLQKGQIDEAITHFQKALEIDPNNAQAHNNFGAALLEKGELDQALVHFREALRLYPDYDGAQKNLTRTEAMIQARKE